MESILRRYNGIVTEKESGSDTRLFFFYPKANNCLPQNRYPHDFKFGHDTRIDEYRSARAKADDPTTSLITNEFNLKSKSMVQCYGQGNKPPSEEAKTFIKGKWLPYAKRKLRKIATADHTNLKHRAISPFAQ